MMDCLDKFLNGTVKLRFCSPEISSGSRAVPSGLKLHKHPYREILIVLDGENDFIMNSRSHHLTPGSVALLDSWVLHNYGYSMHEHDFLHIWMYFSDNHIRSTLYRGGMPGHCEISGTTHLPPYAAMLINSRWNELKKQEKPSMELTERYLLSPMRCVLEDLRFQNRDADMNKPEHSDLVFTLKQYIESHIGRDCSLENLEKIFGYSRYYLAHKFSETQGVSIGTYINTVRLDYTEKALMNGFKQKEIAYELGFSSPASFWKWFRNNRQSRENARIENF